jgi:putative FmdB family regulatory protein
MPNFEFVCEDCGASFELNLPISKRDGRDEACPECEGGNIARQLAAPSFKVSSSAPPPPCGAYG